MKVLCIVSGTALIISGLAGIYYWGNKQKIYEDVRKEKMQVYFRLLFVGIAFALSPNFIGLISDFLK